MFSLYYSNFGEDILVKSFASAENLMQIKRALYRAVDSPWIFQPADYLSEPESWQAIAELAYTSGKETWVYMGCSPYVYHLYLRIHGDNAYQIPMAQVNQLLVS